MMETQQGGVGSSPQNILTNMVHRANKTVVANTSVIFLGEPSDLMRAQASVGSK